jgi:hypothetical protein
MEGIRGGSGERPLNAQGIGVVQDKAQSKNLSAKFHVLAFSHIPHRHSFSGPVRLAPRTHRQPPSRKQTTYF